MEHTILIGIGIILLLLSFFSARQSFYLYKNGVKTKASVIDYKKGYRNNTNDLILIFKFKTQSGEEIVFDSFGATSPPLYAIGEEVDIIYNPLQPQKAKVFSLMGIFGLSIILAFITIVLFIIGICYSK